MNNFEILFNKKSDKGLVASIFIDKIKFVEIFKEKQEIMIEIKFYPTKDIWECEDPNIHQFIRGLPEGPIK